MAYLSPKFTNDIFLSYARVDNKAIRPEDAWVNFFKASLELELIKKIGRDELIKIWMDTEKVASNQRFENEIKNQIRSSGVFLALTSPGYFHPDSYCLKELKEFYSYAQEPPESLLVGTRSRIFNGRLYKKPIDKWPEEFSGTAGAELFDTTKIASGYPSRIGKELLAEQIMKLADEIFQLLSEYKKTFPEPEPTSPPPEQAKVFLADTVENLRDVRNCVLNALQKEGIRVFRRIPPPYSLPKHDKKATAFIKKADLSIHLFDATPGEKFIGDKSGKTFLWRQADLGLEHSKSQFIWLPPKSIVDIPSIKDKAYREFLTRLENGERDKTRYTFQREPEINVPDEIIKKIKSLQQIDLPQRSTALLETHRKDQRYAVELYKLLLDKALQPYINPDTDDPGKKFRFLEEIVREITVLIIIFGAVASEWVRERLNTSLQLAGTSEPVRLKLCGIYMPPGVGAAERQDSLGSFLGPIPILCFSDPKTLAKELDRMFGGAQ